MLDMSSGVSKQERVYAALPLSGVGGCYWGTCVCIRVHVLVKLEAFLRGSLPFCFETESLRMTPGLPF